jgi:hypothetical protein
VGGSLLGLPFNGLVRGLKNSDCPFCIFGTGFRGINPGNLGLDHLRYLWKRAVLIALRGKKCVEHLSKLGVDTSKVDLLGEPILLSDKRQVEREE